MELGWFYGTRLGSQITTESKRGWEEEYGFAGKHATES
uniref:Uncharacterized protein n=1 Tax=Rhizophora mucronata TaxID=61149 RepID=A0A2P2Q6U8_RHIMU